MEKTKDITDKITNPDYILKQIKSIPNAIEYVTTGTTTLNNLGNTCYLNSILQCLRHTMAFNQHLFTIQTKHSLQHNFQQMLSTLSSETILNQLQGSQYLLLTNYIKIVRLMWGHEQTQLSPIGFLTILKLALPQFNDSHPHDAHELLISLLFLFHDMISVPVVYKFKGSIETDMDHQVYKAHQDWISYYKNKHSTILDIFSGQIRRQVTCQICHHQFYHFDPTMIHDVPIIPSGDLMMCLDHLTALEQLDPDNLYQCETCHAQTQAQTVISFWTVPPVMIFKFNRFYHDVVKGAQKITEKITYPILGLNLSRYVSSPSVGTILYDLYAVTCHVGSMSSGHYYSIVYNDPMKTWIIYNDGRADIVKNLDQIVCPDAYILFYRRR